MREGVCVWVGGVGVQGDGRVVGVGVDVGVCCRAAFAGQGQRAGAMDGREGADVSVVRVGMGWVMTSGPGLWVCGEHARGRSASGTDGRPAKGVALVDIETR